MGFANWSLVIIWVMMLAPSTSHPQEPQTTHSSCDPVVLKNILEGSEEQKRLAWQEFQNHGISNYCVLEKLVTLATQPYSEWAWQEAVRQLEAGSELEYSIFCSNIIRVGREPYAGRAWSKLVSLQSVSRIQAIHNYNRLVLEGNYKLYAWQQLEKLLENNEFDPDFRPSHRYLTNIIQQAPEPYRWWAWQKLLSNFPLSELFDDLDIIIAQNPMDSYAQFVWDEITRQDDILWAEQKLMALEKIADLAGSIRYQKMAVSKILTFPSLTPGSRECYSKLYQVLYSIISEESYSINYNKCFINHDNQAKQETNPDY